MPSQFSFWLGGLVSAIVRSRFSERSEPHAIAMVLRSHHLMPLHDFLAKWDETGSRDFR